jgi:ribosome biogenesis GTPase
MPEGKIVKALSGFYYVLHDGVMIQCRGRGVFRKKQDYTTCR